MMCHSGPRTGSRPLSDVSAGLPGLAPCLEHEHGPQGLAVIVTSAQMSQPLLAQGLGRALRDDCVGRFIVNRKVAAAENRRRFLLSLLGFNVRRRLGEGSRILGKASRVWHVNSECRAY